jgi:Sec7-like guanine-nucleotide exchange factor
MYDSANLSKSVIGEYIAKRDEVNIETLKEFVNLFIFEGVRLLLFKSSF